MTSLAPGTKVYGQAIRETTHWEDILVDKKILRPDEKLETQKLAIEESRQRGERAELCIQEKIAAAERAGLDALDSLEDELNEDDDERVLEQFRLNRLKEMQKDALRAKFGSVETLTRDEYMSKVTQASKTGGESGVPAFVVLELFKEAIENSQVVSQQIRSLAEKHPQVKFVRMVSDTCIENWPDERVPSLFVYYNGTLFTQMLGFAQCGKGSEEALENVLVKEGILKKSSDKHLEVHRKNDDVDDW
jgi:hypothetical protein